MREKKDMRDLPQESVISKRRQKPGLKLPVHAGEAGGLDLFLAVFSFVGTSNLSGSNPCCHELQHARPRTVRPGVEFQRIAMKAFEWPCSVLEG